MATQKKKKTNNTAVPKFDEKLYTEQQVYHRVDVLHCRVVCVAYKWHHKTFKSIGVMTPGTLGDIHM